MNIFIFCSFSTTLIELSDKSNIYGPFFLYVIHELPTSRETHFFLLWKPIKTWLGNDFKEFGISYQDKQSQPGLEKYSDHIKILIWSLRAHFDWIDSLIWSNRDFMLILCWNILCPRYQLIFYFEKHIFIFSSIIRISIRSLIRIASEGTYTPFTQTLLQLTKICQLPLSSLFLLNW